MQLRREWKIFVAAGGVWLERNAFQHAGALAFYTLFSLSPVVIITVSIAGAVFGEEAARGHIVRELAGFIGTAAAKVVEDALVRSRPSNAGLMPALTGGVALALGATTVFAQLQMSLNRIWGVVSRPTRFAIVQMVKTRLLSLALVVAIGFVLLVSLMVNVGVHGVIRYASSRMTVPALALDAVELVLSFFVISAMFGMVFKMLPDVELEWKDVRSAAAMTAALFTVGRYLIAAYLAYTAPDSAYGAAGALVLLLLWVYYSSLILFFGAALTKARLLASNRPVVPKATAVRVTEQMDDLDQPGSGGALSGERGR